MSKKNLQKNNKSTQQPVQAKPQTVEPAIKNEPKASGKPLPLIPILVAILAAISFILYYNTTQNGFVLDDEIMIKSNKIVARGYDGVAELLKTPHMWGYIQVPNDTYRPLSLVMFAIEVGFKGGLNPGFHHLMNVITFVLCTLTFFFFLHHFFNKSKPIAAFIGAFLFAIHPIHTEVVANIKSRDELLCFLFGFLSLNLFMKYMKEGKIWELILGTFVLFLSFISKENVITFVGVVPVLFFFFVNDDKRKAIFISAATVVAAAAFILVRHAILTKYQANVLDKIEFIDNAMVEASFIGKIATAIYISGKYLYLLFIPHPLICNYSYNSIPITNFADIKVIMSLLCYGGLIYYVIHTLFIKKQKDGIAFAIIFFLMTIALFNNMFMLIGAQMGERFLFMPSAGIAIAFAYAIDKYLINNTNQTLDTLKNGKIIAILLPLLLIMGYRTMGRNEDWKDNYTIYKADLEKSPNDCRLSYYLGTAMAETLYETEPDPNKRIEIDKAAIPYLRAASLMYSGYVEANAEMGRIYDRLKQYDSAEFYDKKALKINPNHTIACNNLGSVYLATQRYPEALEMFKHALVTNPGFQLAFFNIARTYNALKQFDSARVYYYKSLATNPKFTDAHMEIGNIFFNLQQYDSAAAHYNAVLAIAPNDANAVNNLGAVYLNGKQYDKAIEWLKKSMSINPQNPNTYSNLGRAYYFNKNYQDAIDIFNKELSIFPQNFGNIPYMALSYQALGNMPMAKQYEAAAKKYYSNFKLN